MQQVSENSIMELIRQRGILRFSTLMVSFHLSSVEAISIVEEYQRRGILDAKGRYASEKTEKTKKPEKIETKIKTIKQIEKTKRHSKKARAKTGREPKEEKNEKTHPA